MKYVIYLRVSTNMQDDRTQLEKCLQFLKHNSKKEFKYLVCTDTLSTRKKLDKRSGLQTALSSLGKGDILVAMRLDRITRNLHETTCIIHELEKKQADIILIDQPGIKNKVLLGLYAGIAEEEVKMIRKRITEKLAVKKTRNERISREVPYGFTLDLENLINIKNQDDAGWTMKPGLLVPESEEQEVLALMCQLFDEGMSYRMIAQELDDQGYKNRRGNSFQHMSIYRILCRTGRTRSVDQPLEEKEFQLFHSL